MSDNTAVFTKYEDRYILMHLKGSKADKIFVYEDLFGTDEGTVINCMAEDHVDNIEASFVRYAPKETGFINKFIKGGVIVPLQYKKGPYRDKKAVFTDKITIDGEYTVVTTGCSYLKISSKIPGPEKEKIHEAFKGCREEKDIGIIVRTRAWTDDNGTECAKKELADICAKIDELYQRSEHTPVYTVLHKPLSAYIRDALLLADEGVEEIVTDIPEIMTELQKDHENITGTVNVSDRVSLRFYEDRLINLCNLYGFNAKISEALSRKVHLKSGAYITFDITEALIAVDVNSASNDKKAAREETFLAVNMEAASEIARQIRIRNLSGMIVIDFINMKDEESYKTLETHIRSVISTDRNGCRFVDFTGLKMCELVRKRSGNPLAYTLNQKR